MLRIGLFFLLVPWLAGCAMVIPPQPEPSPGHLSTDTEAPPSEIPPLVEHTPFLPPPEPQPEQERYTVVVHEVPVKELLFALARDAAMNVDIHPGISGVVTLNAVDQTLPQILDRIARQVDLRYDIRGSNLELMPDTPYFRTYKVDYVNMSRDSTSTVSVATQISTTGVADIGGLGGGGGGAAGDNNSTTRVTSTSNHRFWETLTANILAILGEPPGAGQGGAASDSVIVHPESGIINVRATAREHKEVQHFIDQVMVNVQRQVLIEATVVEVELSDRYQAGVDWSAIASGAGFRFNQSLLGTALATAPFFLLGYQDQQTDFGSVDVTIRLLKEYGNTRVLSSPKLMVLNNQTAMLKVVDNIVYFTLEQETNTTQGVVTNTFETTVHTVPVGLVMAVTPQINANRNVTLNVRPTISRVTRFVNDPNPALTIDSPIPEIQVREMESMLQVGSGQIAMLGGLMQDSLRRDDAGIPLLSRIPGIGEAFKTRDHEVVKTELVIFLRPVVIANPSVDADLADYRRYLDPNHGLAPVIGVDTY